MSADEGLAPLTVFSDLAAAADRENMGWAGGWQEPSCRGSRRMDTAGAEGFARW